MDFCVLQMEFFFNWNLNKKFSQKKEMKLQMD